MQKQKKMNIVGKSVDCDEVKNWDEFIILLPVFHFFPLVGMIKHFAAVKIK